jgi:hypothetical protein
MNTTNDALYRSLGRIEGKQDLILTQMASDRENHKDLAVRVDKIERRFYTWGGVFSAVIFALTFFGRKISEALVG